MRSLRFPTARSALRPWRRFALGFRIELNDRHLVAIAQRDRNLWAPLEPAARGASHRGSHRNASREIHLVDGLVVCVGHVDRGFDRLRAMVPPLRG